MEQIRSYSANSFNVFKKEILKFIRPSSNSFYNCHNPIGIKYITRIRLGLRHLRGHKFKHSFQDSINPICNCGNDVESAIHFFLHCPLYSNECCTFLNSLSKIDHKLLDSTDTSLTQILLFGNSSFTTNDNTKIINLTIDFVLSTKRFDGPLLSTVIFFSSLIQTIINKPALHYFHLELFYLV